MNAPLAGLLAAAPMTAAMVALHRRLPRAQQYALPPGRIVSRATGRRHENLTLAAHLAFAATAGAAYGLTPKTRRPILDGAAFGAVVWAVSYLGWLPATGLLPARSEPPRRHALMLAAHLVWGACLGLLAAGSARR